MTSLKKHIVYTFLAIFVVTAFVGLSGVIGWVEIKPDTVKWVFALLIAQSATVIVTIIKAPEYFSEPEAIAQAKEEYLTKIEELQKQLTQSIKDRENMVAFFGSKILPDDPRHPLYNLLHNNNNPNP
ncbi:MAG: hypothetical protein GX654_05450 [Desulfatiglans sp.]|jgi:hypothetical protein|nr:hypothetical protein [Desulfatiglans sp.]